MAENRSCRRSSIASHHVKPKSVDPEDSLDI